MGLAWQYVFKSPDSDISQPVPLPSVSDQISGDDAFDENQIHQMLSAALIGISVFGVVAFLALFPETIPALLAAVEAGDDVQLTSDVVAMLYRAGVPGDTIDALFDNQMPLSLEDLANSNPDLFDSWRP